MMKWPRDIESRLLVETVQSHRQFRKWMEKVAAIFKDGTIIPLGPLEHAFDSLNSGKLFARRAADLAIQFQFDEIADAFEAIVIGPVSIPQLVELFESTITLVANGGSGTPSPHVQPPTVPTPEPQLNQLERAVRNAYLAFQHAETVSEKRLTDREAYAWLRENGIDQDKGAPGELTDYELPKSRETFQRYLGAARKSLGSNKYAKRGGQMPSRSIVRGTDIEYQKRDGV